MLVQISIPRKLTCSEPKAHFSGHNLSPDRQKHWNICLKYGRNCSGDSPPHPISSMNCVHTFAETHGSKQFLTKALNLTTDMFNPLANR